MGNGVSIRAVAFPSTTNEWLRWGLGVAIFGLIYWAFWGQVVEVGAQYRWSCWQWLLNQWKVTTTHGPLIPIIVVGLIYSKWHEIRAVLLQPALWGAAVIAVAMGFYWLGVKAMQPRIVVFAFVLLLSGLTLTLGGRELHKVLFFPIIYLLLMIPLNFLDERIGFPLRILMARTSTLLLNGMGIETVRIGTRIISSAFAFDVENPCSGIRSLTALTTVTAAFAYVTQRTQWKRWVLFLSAIPLAVLGNVARVLGIALVGHAYGQEIAMRLHDTAAGFIVFGVALTAMVAFGLLLNVPYRRIVERWMKPVRSRPAGRRRERLGRQPVRSIMSESPVDQVAPVTAPTELGAHPAPAAPAVATGSRGPSLLHLGVVVGILAAGVVITAFTSDVDKISEPGIRVFHAQDTAPDGRVVTVDRPYLPDQVSQWKGGALEGLSQAERDILPKDTQGARRIYTRSDGKQLYCSIVLAGRDVTSIHRPEMCLPGQGWTIQGENVEELPVPTAPGGLLGVMRMNTVRDVPTADGRTMQARSIFAYWFVGKDRVTPHHWQRILWTTRDRVFHNTNHRWAYILIHAPVAGENRPGPGAEVTAPEDQAMQLVANFVQDVYPTLMVK